MKRNNLFKILIIIFVACLLLVTMLTHPTDGFIMPALFSLIMLFVSQITISSPAETGLQFQSHIVYQLRAPPFPLI